MKAGDGSSVIADGNWAKLDGSTKFTFTLTYQINSMCEHSTLKTRIQTLLWFKQPLDYEGFFILKLQYDSDYHKNEYIIETTIGKGTPTPTKTKISSNLVKSGDVPIMKIVLSFNFAEKRVSLNVFYTAM